MGGPRAGMNAHRQIVFLVPVHIVHPSLLLSTSSSERVSHEIISSAVRPISPSSVLNAVRITSQLMFVMHS